MPIAVFWAGDQGMFRTRCSGNIERSGLSASKEQIMQTGHGAAEILEISLIAAEIQ